MIVGIGLDVVNIERFVRTLTSALSARLFTDDERSSAARDETLAGWFAAKEALVKALDGLDGLDGYSWHDIRMSTGSAGQPILTLNGTIATLAEARGVDRIHVSISHDDPVAAATVILEGERQSST